MIFPTSDTMTFATRDDTIARNLHRNKAVLRGAMAALKSNLEPWERREIEAGRRIAVIEIREIVHRFRHLSVEVRQELFRAPADLMREVMSRALV